MSEQTRMSKYKDLRDNIDDDTYVPHEEDDADDDFLSFIPKSNHRESLEPKTYETLKYESNPFESGSLTVDFNLSLTTSLKTLIISMLLSFFIVKFVKL